MASVFLSYGHDDASRARPIAAALEKAGHSVWWDFHLRGGAQFSKVIDEALQAADVVVVLWSCNSVESAWVRDEAAAGRDSGRLVPVTLDGTEPPLGFRQFQTIDLRSGRGKSKADQLKRLLADVESISTDEAKSQPKALASRSEVLAGMTFGRKRLVLAAAALLIIAAALAWRYSPNSKIRGDKAIAVAVVASDASRASQLLSRDVRLKIGALQGKSASSLRLLLDPGTETPDLQIAVTSENRNGVSADVALLSSGDNAILWSRHLKFSMAGGTDVGESVAVAATRAVGCAAQELSGAHGRLSAQNRRSYLEACASAGESGWDASVNVPALRRIVAESPRFTPAWASLLVAEANEVNALSGAGDPTEQARADLQQDIAVAAKIDPGMAELAIARVAAASRWPIAQSIAVLDQAKKAHPENPDVLNARVQLLQSVGRVLEAVGDAQRARDIDPLTPRRQAAYVEALIVAGHIEQARDELRRAVQLWPDSPPVEAAGYALAMRYGDPEQALRQSGARMDEGILTYVRARRAPTDANKDAFVLLANSRQLNFAQKRFVLQAFPELDRVDQLYLLIETWPIDQEWRNSSDLLFRPWVAGFRRDPRFVRFAKRFGLVDYWQKSGQWPDFCSEPDTKYDCKAEAAKLH